MDFKEGKGFVLYDIWLWIYTERNEEAHVRTIVENFEPGALKLDILEIVDGGEISGDMAGIIPDKAMMFYMNIIKMGLNEEKMS